MPSTKKETFDEIKTQNNHVTKNKLRHAAGNIIRTLLSITSAFYSLIFFVTHPSRIKKIYHKINRIQNNK